MTRPLNMTGAHGAWQMMAEMRKPTDPAAANLIPLFAEEARKRQLSGLKQGAQSPVPTSRGGRAMAGESVEHAAKMVGVGETTVSKVAR
jgi:hypothetical protein